MSMHPSRNLFKEFPNKYYVETGAWLGDSIQLAIEAGFGDIISIELDQAKAEHCRQRFSDLPVKIIEGDSAIVLWDAIKNIHAPITFWLDSHSQLLEDESETENPFPLMKELEQIARHPFKNHTIIIDDFLYLTHPDITGWSCKMILEKLWEINLAYTLDLFANPIKDNILVAHV